MTTMRNDNGAIPCFQCGAKPGMDCPGRRPGEATRCEGCTREFMARERERQLRHLAEMVRSFRERGDGGSERELWAALDGAAYEDIQRLSAELGGRRQAAGDGGGGDT